MLVTLATAAFFLGFYLFILALPACATGLGASRVGVGVLIAVLPLTAAASRLLTGRLVDRLGRKPFLVIGLLVFIVATAAHAAADGLVALFMLRALHGVGWGWMITAVGTLAADLAPPERRGEAIGIWGAAPTIALAAGPLAGGWLLASRGFGWVFLTTAAMGAVALLLVLPVKDPPRPAVREGAKRIPPGALLPAATLLLSSLSYGALIAFLPVELADSPRLAGSFFTILALTILISRPLAGLISDRRGRLAVIHPGLLAGAAGIALLSLAPSPEALAAAAVLYGAGVGGGSFPGLMAMTVDRSHPGERGAALAVYFTAYDLAIAAGALLLGPIYQGFGFGALCLAAAAGIVLGQGLLLAGTPRRGADQDR